MKDKMTPSESDHDAPNKSMSKQHKRQHHCKRCSSFLHSTKEHDEMFQEINGILIAPLLNGDEQIGN